MASNVEMRRAAVPATRDINRWIGEPLLVLAGYLLVEVLGLLTGASPLRAALATVLALFGSGFSLAAVLFPRARQLDLVERAAVSGGLSLAVGGLTAFLMAISPWRLTALTFLTGTLAFNIACYLMLIYRRHRLTAAEIPDWTSFSIRGRAWWGRQPEPSRWVTVGIILFLIAGLGALYQAALTPGRDPAMTEFYLLDENGLAQDFPTSAVAGDPLSLICGITNLEGAGQEYQIRAFVDGALVGVGQPARVEAGATRTVPVDLMLTEQEIGNRKVDIILYRGQQQYRALHLWLDVQPADQPAGPAN